MGVTSEILIQIPKEGKLITGETIKGIVKFHLDKETEYMKISLSLFGRASCMWYENQHSYEARRGQHARQRRKVGTHYIFEGHEMIEVKKIYLLNKDINETTPLSAGSHEHPFEIMIPENIPPSVKTDIGEIKYYLVLKFKKPALSFNENFKTKITIYPSVDASMTDEPIFFAQDKTLFKLFSSKKHEIKLQGELDKGYLIPNGENKISFVVTNNTKVIFTVKTELISKTEYKDNFMVKKYAFDNPKTVCELIDFCTVETPSIPDNSVSNMFNTIPVAPEVHTVRHSEIISREYILRVTLKLPLPYVNSSVEIPVFIGEKLQKANDEVSEEPSGPIEGPPSYWEAMSEDKSKDFN